jgi:hypothetical protein
MKKIQLMVESDLGRIAIIIGNEEKYFWMRHLWLRRMKLLMKPNTEGKNVKL